MQRFTQYNIENENRGLIINGKRIWDSINIIIKKQDSKLREQEYLSIKYLEAISAIYINARNIFTQGLSIKAIKCIYGYNHHGKRDKIINVNITDKCDVCQKIETWDNIILCPCTRLTNQRFIKKLEVQLQNKNSSNTDIRTFIKNLKNYLSGSLSC